LSDAFDRESGGGIVDVLDLAHVWLTGRNAGPLDNRIDLGRYVSKAVLGEQASETLREIFASDDDDLDELLKFVWKNVARRTTGVPTQPFELGETPLGEVIGDTVLDVLINAADRKNAADTVPNTDHGSDSSEQSPVQGKARRETGGKTSSRRWDQQSASAAAEQMQRPDAAAVGLVFAEDDAIDLIFAVSGTTGETADVD
jgi:hypothetical protein